MNKKFALIFVVILLTACGGSDHGSVDGSYSKQVEIQDITLTLFRSFSSGSYVLQSQSEFENAWASAPFQLFPVGIVIEEPPMPTYDYSKYTVIGLSLGTGYWCFRPILTSAFTDGTNMIVHYYIPTSSTSACLRNGPLISFALVPRFQGTLELLQDVIP